MNVGKKRGEDGKRDEEDGFVSFCRWDVGKFLFAFCGEGQRPKVLDSRVLFKFEMFWPRDIRWWTFVSKDDGCRIFTKRSAFTSIETRGDCWILLVTNLRRLSRCSIPFWSGYVEMVSRGVCFVDSQDKHLNSLHFLLFQRSAPSHQTPKPTWAKREAPKRSAGWGAEERDKSGEGSWDWEEYHRWGWDYLGELVCLQEVVCCYEE